MHINQITINHLNQLRKLVVCITDEQLSTSLPVLSKSSIGAHIRHVLEFYMCLFELGHSKKLNYDNRRRDKTVEVCTGKCLENIDKVISELGKNKIDFDLTLTADYGTNMDKQPVNVQTSFFRELLYNIEHLVHHLAIIKIGVQSFDSAVSLCDDLGIAASTKRNQELCAQ